MRNRSDNKWIASLRELKDYSWCTDDQWECCKLLFDLVGDNHLFSAIKAWGTGISYKTGEDFSTFDFDLMTIAVFMAHDRCIRISIRHASKGMINICLWKRQREGVFSRRHPTIETALGEYRKQYPMESIDEIKEQA